jgi:hypothetical protein
VKAGYVKLPSLEMFKLDDIATNITTEMNGSTFTELCLVMNSSCADLTLSNI